MEGFPQTIAAALRDEWGSSPSARKAVGLITRANERTVRNWFEGRNGPSGANLVLLIRHSDAVFESVLKAAGRRPALTAIRAAALRGQLRSLLDQLNETLDAQ